MRRSAVLVALVLLFLLVPGVLAMSSASYRLDWYTPVTGSGGGPASSANYAIDLTVGQVGIGPAASGSYRAGLGYWYGLGGAIVQQFRSFLPAVSRNSP